MNKLMKTTFGTSSKYDLNNKNVNLHFNPGPGDYESKTFFGELPKHEINNNIIKKEKTGLIK